MPSNEPGKACGLCPRLVAFRATARAAHPDWHNAPVPNFGPVAAPMLIVGLAPGLQGANRTGRPFTGDWAGDLLYETLLEFGFATGCYEERADDTLQLTQGRIVNAVRCVPPENKPTGAEVATCRQFLAASMAEMTGLKAIVALGRIAHDSVVRTLNLPAARFGFAHGAQHALPDGRVLFDSYHCSRYNTNTGRLTPAMFRAVFQAVRGHIGA
ncbi:MAG TPA: uracil-DNA glycosylase [Beijerinckiaceae bacterium]|nr:uracil-DNA glycosylase [Beijerinckiaceae bacterium]